jgi:hypothetical protein
MVLRTGPRSFNAMENTEEVEVGLESDTSVQDQPFKAHPKLSMAWRIFLEHRQKVFMLLGPLVGVPFFFLDLEPRIASTAYVVLWMGTAALRSVRI